MYWQFMLLALLQWHCCCGCWSRCWGCRLSNKQLGNLLEALVQQRQQQHHDSRQGHIREPKLHDSHASQCVTIVGLLPACLIHSVLSSGWRPQLPLVTHHHAFHICMHAYRQYILPSGVGGVGGDCSSCCELRVCLSGEIWRMCAAWLSILCICLRCTLCKLQFVTAVQYWVGRVEGGTCKASVALHIAACLVAHPLWSCATTD